MIYMGNQDLFTWSENAPNELTQAEERMRVLETQIHHHNHLYYDIAKPEISDRAFDALLEELKKLEEEYPQFAAPDSPTQRVGGAVTKQFPTVVHQQRMYSLDNAYEKEAVLAFDKRVQQMADEPVSYVCEPKIDGVAIRLTYKKGVLFQAVTRGDGVQGDEVTANVKTIRSIPLKLKGEYLPEQLTLSGEIYLPRARFEMLNQQVEVEGLKQGLSLEEIQEKKFKNPRNTAAGTLKLQDSKEVARRRLEAFIYHVIEDKPTVDSHAELIENAKKWGCKVPEVVQVCSSIEEVMNQIDLMDALRHQLPYDTDGVVVKVNPLSVQSQLGFTAKSPRWAIAFKFQTEQAFTRIRSFDFQVGRTGAITPVANLDPVLLGGTTVKRASVHNADFIAQLDLRVGDTVVVEKGGEIIPKIVEVNHALRPSYSHPLVFPSHCPECGAALVKRNGEAQHFCPDEWVCRPQLIGKLVHFVSRKAMHIESLGEKTIQTFFDQGWVRKPSDFYQLTIQQIASLEGFKEKSAENILAGLKSAETVPFPRVLFAVGIRHVGETVAQKLAAAYGSLAALRETSREALLSVPEIGEVIADSVWHWLKDETLQAEMDRLAVLGLQMASIKKQVDGPQPLLGKTFVISGVFTHYSRDGLKEAIEQAGGKVSTSISKQTHYVVAGDQMGPAKREKAESLGVQIISEETFHQMLT
jgi:DNA ligase (NAD+)